jgi:hypothetical protein
MKIDVLVCGGGCAGLGAAVAAARSGASVLLVERAPFAGGIITAVGLPFLDGIACWHTGRLIVRGLALETLCRLGQASNDARRIEDIRSALGGLTRHGSVSIPCIDRFKLVADSLLLESGVRLLFHSMVCGTEVRQGRIERVIVACKDGLLRIEPEVVIDSTGDADVAHYSGCPMDSSQERMPMTMHFRVGNVRDHARLRSLAADALRRAQDEGALPMYYGPGLSTAFAPNEVYVHAVRVPGNAVDAFDLTRAEIQGRRDAWTMFEYWKKYVPGFEDSYYIGSGPFIGVRETRRIAGVYVLSETDILERRAFDDAIATGSWYMDAHPNHTTEGSAHPKQEKNVPPEPYDIPYRALLPYGVENLVVAGRCHSASRRAASSTRVTVTAMALGEAAGEAASLALARKTSVAALDGRSVRDRLSTRGAGPFTQNAF